jgi:hypothetical protein
MATRCEDPCAGLTLRKLTPADSAASGLARSVAGCCGWSWAGFGGFSFEADGRLITPWGGGVWGAPPESQATGKKPALLAEFAGSKHLLRARLGQPVNGKRTVSGFESTRCADNDVAQVRAPGRAPRRCLAADLPAPFYSVLGARAPAPSCGR